MEEGGEDLLGDLDQRRCVDVAFGDLHAIPGGDPREGRPVLAAVGERSCAAQIARDEMAMALDQPGELPAVEADEGAQLEGLRDLLDPGQTSTAEIGCHSVTLAPLGRVSGRSGVRRPCAPDDTPAGARRSIARPAAG